MSCFLKREKMDNLADTSSDNGCSEVVAIFFEFPWFTVRALLFVP